MDRVFRIVQWFSVILIFIMGLLYSTAVAPVNAQAPAATPTYDPLVEPVLPEHPTEFELGRNLYWHWCMTCHGDRGQGLTDEWRFIWEEDHQNCWARGCHAGNNSKGEEIFVIPTVVPLIIGEDHLAKYDTYSQLADYLNLTHPPQHPGILTQQEYAAIAVYVFTQNDRPLITATPIPTPTSTNTPVTLTATPIAPPLEAISTQLPPKAQTHRLTPISGWLALILIFTMIGASIWLNNKRLSKKR